MAEDTKGEFTQEKFDELYEMVDRDYRADYESAEVSDRINDPDFFRSFSERLLAFYNEVNSSCFTDVDAAKDLLRRAKSKSIHINTNTIKKWFSDAHGLNHGVNDRKRLFVIAFVMDLDARQTEQLFHKVFLDKAFNKRNCQEFIYLYCIVKGLPLSVADSLMSHVDCTDNTVILAESIESTRSLADAAERIHDEDELLLYIKTHSNSFALKNTKALQRRQDLLKDLTGTDETLGFALLEFKKRGSELSDDKHEYEKKHKAMSSYGRNLSDNCEKDLLLPHNRTPTSIDFMLDTIFNPSFAEKAEREILSIRDKFKSNEIEKNFPDKYSIADPSPSSYALRKDIILIYFYWHWVQVYLGKSWGNKKVKEHLKDKFDYGPDDFIDGLNSELFECGFSPLYLGNPYDWLFLYCSTCASDMYSPLDKFRLILSHKNNGNDDAF